MHVRAGEASAEFEPGLINLKTGAQPTKILTITVAFKEIYGGHCLLQVVFRIKTQ